MSTLVLVRHATSLPPSEDGLNEYERPLTAHGLGQADALVEHLLALAPGRFLSSPYLRALQTIQPAARMLGIPVEPRDDLREWNSGIAATPNWKDHYRYCWDHPQWSVVEGENHETLTRRAMTALRRAANERPESVTIIGSHGTWISRALHGLGCDVDANFWFDMPMPAIYVVQLKKGTANQVTGPGLDAR